MRLSAAKTKSTSDCHPRARYKFGKTLGAGTYGIVREAECADGKVAIKIILKKNVKGNEQMVYDELAMLQRLKHPHIVRFRDWFESRVCGSESSIYRISTLTSGFDHLGQILYRDPACHRRRAIRSDM